MLRIHKRVRAFTFVEMVIVLLIIGLFTAIATPRAASSIANYRVKMAAYRIAADLDYARKNARIIGANQQLSFDQSGSSYTLAGVSDLDKSSDGYFVDLTEEPYGVSVSAVDFGGDTVVSFDGYGLPDSGGSVTIALGSRQITITLDAKTGKASIGP